ncbi:AmmeMemoRadiSam system radical SAM enzyme [Candidatus Fermentibacteria bacterium]|nr:AmmeMemoRadiSam system radical SAM enzyme [Candidatus Fermentibacteria bacterium]
MKTPRWVEREGKGWRCGLCPRGCLWTAASPLGACRVRGLSDGVPSLPGWGRCVSLSIDPIEKKPLYHFLPGSLILSTGPAGCNLSCMFCQNWEISQGDPRTHLVMPEVLAHAAMEDGSRGIAFTYSEPVIWFEYIMETATMVKKAGGAVVMVSNGYVNRAPLDELLYVTDAWNVDLKSWSKEFYESICGGNRDTVLESIKRLALSGKHLEITFLLIPGRNDRPAEWDEMARWIAGEAGSGVPLHISRYFPRYRMTEPPTPLSLIYDAVDAFSRHLEFVYPGNVSMESNTVCRKCGAVVVRRAGWSVDRTGLSRGGCASCGAPTGIVDSL